MEGLAHQQPRPCSSLSFSKFHVRFVTGSRISAPVPGSHGSPGPLRFTPVSPRFSQFLPSSLSLLPPPSSLPMVRHFGSSIRFSWSLLVLPVFVLLLAALHKVVRRLRAHRTRAAALFFQRFTRSISTVHMPTASARCSVDPAPRLSVKLT